MVEPHRFSHEVMAQKETMNKTKWQYQTILNQRIDGWEWDEIRKYWLLLDDWLGFNYARLMEQEEKQQ